MLEDVEAEVRQSDAGREAVVAYQDKIRFRRFLVLAESRW